MNYGELATRLRNIGNGGIYEKCEGCKYAEDYPDCVGCTHKAFHDAADAIEELNRLRVAAEENRMHWQDMAVKFECDLHDAEGKIPKWISVNKGLPEFDQVVLVSDGHDVDTGWAVQFTERDGEKKVIWASPFADFDDVDSITHWMPLPNPPKEEP